jgi:hypothetical protein
MKKYHLNSTKDYLKGPTQEQITSYNQWAATALDLFHKDSKSTIELCIDGEEMNAILEWDSNFSKAAMKEKKDIANYGGVAMAWFVMSVILDFRYVEQTEIGDGVDYRFKKEEPNEDDLNFLDNAHYVEISGILEESKTNTLQGRIKEKHAQIKKGNKKDKESSVIVTLFKTPKTVKEIHK